MRVGNVAPGSFQVEVVKGREDRDNPVQEFLGTGDDRHFLQVERIKIRKRFVRLSQLGGEVGSQLVTAVKQNNNN